MSTITKSGRLAEIRRYVCISKSQWIFLVSFSSRILGCAYTICSYGQIYTSCTIPSGLFSSNLLCLVLYSFRANLPHSLIIWLIFLSLSLICICYFASSCLYLFWHYYYYYYYYCFCCCCSFSHQLTLMVFHWSLSDNKSPQVSRTLLSILAVLNNAVVWVISTCPPNSKSSSPYSNLLVTVPKAPIKIGILVTSMLHSFFNSLARSRYLSFFSHSFSFILWLARTTKSTILQVLFFLLIIIRSGLLAEIRRSVCMSKSHRSLCVLFSRTSAGLCIYLLVWSIIIIIIVIVIIIIYSLEFFTSALTDGLSLEIEWQQVWSSLQDSFQYSGHFE